MSTDTRSVAMGEKENTELEGILDRSESQRLKKPFRFKKVIKIVMDSESSDSSPLLQLVFEKEKKQIKQFHKKVDILDYLLDASNFEIDLLESFEEQQIYCQQLDPSGKHFYKQLCEKVKLPPISYIFDHLEDKNFIMQQHYLSKEKLMIFIEALKQNTTIETMDLSDNNMCPETVVCLVEVLKKNSKVFSLNLSHNNIQKEGVSALSTLLDVTPTLTSLFVARNCLENDDITPLVLTLKANFFLTTLDLSYNKISSDGGFYLGSCLAMNETLNILDLHWCQIAGKGAVELVKGLKQNPSLKVLDISWNGFSEDSCWSLALSLISNCSLKIIDLTKNRLLPRSGHLLATGLKKNSSIEILILDNNLLGDDGVNSLLKIMPNHPSLQLLSFQGVRVSEKLSQQVVEMERLSPNSLLQNDSFDKQSQLEKLCYLYLSRLEEFIKTHKTALESIFEKYDPDKKGYFGKEHMRRCLEKAGFYLTLTHMAVLLAKMKKNEMNLIAYKPLFDGSISKMIKAEELKRKFNTAATRTYYMAPKPAWN